MFSDDRLLLLSEQLGTIESDEIRAAYLRFATGLNELDGIEARPDGHGYISSEIRGYSEVEWYYSAVLNKGWVLFYFRWPAIRDNIEEEGQVLDAFPTAERTAARDIKLRVPNRAEATAVIDFLKR